MGTKIGRLQNRILARLGQGPTTLESLRWDLWLNGIEPTNVAEVLSRQMPASDNNKVRSAVQKLVSAGRVKTAKRHLHGLNELATHYPNKSLKADVRFLRRTLLPVLLEWVSSRDGPRPAYNLAQNELHELDNLGDRKVKELSSKWAEFESDLLRSIVDTPSGQNRDDLFLLCAKGKSLLGMQRLDCKPAFSDLLKSTGAMLPDPLRQKMADFKNSLLNDDRAGYLHLKSVVLALADVPDLGSCSLLKETVDHLESKSHELLASLPEYTPGSPPAKRVSGRHSYDANGFAARRPEQSPLLHLLIDQKVLGKFTFLTRADGAP